MSLTFFIANITAAPSSVTAPLYSLANFICEGTGEELLWSIGSNSLSDLIKHFREISITTIGNISVDMWSSLLTIRALPINDGISVGCNVVSYNPYVHKIKGATLTISGVSPVKKLNFASSASSTSWLIWSSPSFYSNDIPKQSIPTYHVVVKSKDGLILINTNTTDTFYKMPNTFSDCGYYVASVTAFIEQYSSVVSTTTKESTESKIILISLVLLLIIRLYY